MVLAQHVHFPGRQARCPQAPGRAGRRRASRHRPARLEDELLFGVPVPVGFVLLTLASAGVVAAVVNPESRLGPILGWRPLRWVGVRSYGIYLWQWPIIVLAAPSQGGIEWWRATLEVAGTVLIAGLSWRYVEEPIRQGALGRRWRQIRSGSRRLTARRRTLALSGSAAGALSLAVLGPRRPAAGGLGRGGFRRRSSGGRPRADRRRWRRGGHGRRSDRLTRPRGAAPRRAPAPLPGGRGPGSRPTPPAARSSTSGIRPRRERPPRTTSPTRGSACNTARQRRRANHPARDLRRTIDRGDVRRPAQRRHRRPGAHLPGLPRMLDRGHGNQRCRQRPRRLHLQLIDADRPHDVDHRQPAGPVGGCHHPGALGGLRRGRMQGWNRALVAACAKYPTMRVFDWAAWRSRGGSSLTAFTTTRRGMWRART